MVINITDLEGKILDSISSLDKSRIHKVELKRYNRKNGTEYIQITIEVDVENKTEDR